MVLITFLFTLSGLIIRNFHLTSTLFYDWDEGMYAQIASEILKNKSLFTTFNGQIWLDKPPLVHFLIAFVFSIFGRSEFWARMLMVLASFILLTITYLLARKIGLAFTKKTSHKEIVVASLLPILTLAASPIFLERTTTLNSDLFVAIGWIGYFLFIDSYWPKLFFLTLGVWSKSVLGFYPLLIDVLNWLAKQFLSPSRSKSQTLTINKVLKGLLFIIIPCLWYISGLIKFGSFFINNHFLSQVFKRLYVPIELHFGNKFFYLSYLYKNLTYINILFIIAYTMIFIDLLVTFKEKRFNILHSSKWPAYLILFFPLPFLLLLTIMRTKITWYVVIFLPFLTLLLPYLYLKIKSPILKLGFVIMVLVYFFQNFIPQTFLLKNSYSPPEKLSLAKCLSKIDVNKIGFLVDEQERKNRNFLEAAHYDTTSSFYYGGSPSFVFYAQKNIDYYYNIDDFIKNNHQYKVIVLSEDDFKKNINLSLIVRREKISCRTNNWLGIVK